MNLPKLFTGEKTVATWGERRKEILALLGQYEYGVTPEIKLDKVTYTTPFIMELAGNIQYETHRAFFKAGDKFCSMRFEIFSRQTDKPLPSILMCLTPARITWSILTFPKKCRTVCRMTILRRRGMPLC